MDFDLNITAKPYNSWKKASTSSWPQTWQRILRPQRRKQQQQMNWISSKVRTFVHQRTFYQDNAKTTHRMGQNI